MYVQEILVGLLQSAKSYNTAYRSVEIAAERRHSNLDSGVSATTDLMTRPDRPTAIYYADTEMAIGGIRAAQQMGLTVPGDLSILAIGDFRFAEYITPKLSLIRQSVFDIAKRAGSVLAEQIMHKDNEIHQEFVPCDLLINDTTGPMKTKQLKR